VAGEEPNRNWLNPLDFVENLLLIQEWGPDPQRGWNFVAWSLSMEWLAYRALPAAGPAAVAEPIAGCRPPGPVALWVIVLVLGGDRDFPQPTPTTRTAGSTIRILTEFTAGALTYLIVRIPIGQGEPGAAPSRSVERTATAPAAVLPALVVLGAVDPRQSCRRPAARIAGQSLRWRQPCPLTSTCRRCPC
jgi:peptidoglycan/LPS O-acetylase OafA/YrhL